MAIEGLSVAPHVSVIIPCWNVGAVVASALESVLRQSYGNFDVVCIDDGSDDDTLGVLTAFEDRYPRTVRVLTIPRAGAAAARNKGLHVTTGEFVQFLDADDTLHPEKLSHQVRILAEAERRVDLIAGAYYKRRLDGSRKVFQPRTDDWWIALARTQLGHTSSNLWRRSAVLAAGGWDEGLKSSQEYDLLFRILKRNPAVIPDERPLTTVHERRGSISRSDLCGNLLRHIDLRRTMRQELIDRRELTDERREAIDAVIFTDIRALAHHDLETAERLYKELLPSEFRPRISSATTRKYAIAHRIFGFSRAERAARAFRRLRGDPLQAPSGAP